MNDVYFEVSKSLFDEIQDMKERQERIPHYRANMLPIEGFESLSFSEKMKLVKYNMTEATKQYQNEEEKGWISSNGYTYFRNKEKHVLPIIKKTFDLKGLSEHINDSVEELAKVEYGGWTDEAKNRCAMRYIRFIDDGLERKLMECIRDCEDVSNLQFYYQLYFSKYTNDKHPTGVMFWFENEKGVLITYTSSSTRRNKFFPTIKEASEHWEIQVGNAFLPLFGWNKHSF